MGRTTCATPELGSRSQNSFILIFFFEGGGEEEEEEGERRTYAMAS